MLIQKDNPVGIDKQIAFLQKRLHDVLVNQFGWPSDGYYSYERVYINVREGQRIPELYVGSSDAKNNEYREIYFNDNHIAESYFVVEDNRPNIAGSSMYQATVGLIFQVDLRKLFPSLEHRGDEEVHRQVQIALQGFRSVLGEITGLITGLACYTGLDTRQIQQTDMHPCHVFRFNFNVPYIYNC